MRLWLVWLFIKSIESFHSLNPADLSCKKRDYRLITDQSAYIVYLDDTLTTIHAAIGLDNKQISPLLTELWYEQTAQQSLILQSSWHLFKVDGDLNNNNSWNFKFSSIINKSDLSLQSKSILHIQSTLFKKQIDLVIRNKSKQNDHCSNSHSSIDLAICCGLCTTTNTCPELKILHEHSRYDIIVTNRSITVLRSFKTSICSRFPLDEPIRFWSTITNAMNIGQTPDTNDLAIVYRTDGIIKTSFYYSFYPFHQWNQQILNFSFMDILLIPHEQLAIFELNQCNKTLCKLLLHIYQYKLNKTIQLNSQLYFPEILIENDVLLSTYFHLYFDILSNMLYLIGKRNIYASNNYGEKLNRIRTEDLLSEDSIILNPIMFSDTGHIAFIYRWTNDSSCCHYFAIFSKAGLYHGWRTRTLRSFVLMDEPFFFDSSGSFYFNVTPPLLVIQATEQSLVATPQLLVNSIPGPFFVRETDMNRFFVLCSLTLWDNRFELVGSTLQFDKLGLFFVINMDTSSSPFTFCLQTSRLDYEPLRTFRQCQLTIHYINTTKKIHLQLSGCVYNTEDVNSTIIISKFPNIFIDHILNDTFATGIIFEEPTSGGTQVEQWNIIHIQKVEQILDRCLLKNIDQNYHRPSLIYVKPTVNYSIADGDQLVSESFNLLSNSDYMLHQNIFDDNLFVTASSFDNRKSVIRQQFIRSQLSCYLPFTRTITLITKCLSDTIIRPKFEINSELSKLIQIEPPINFQLNRYEAGFNSVIVYNLDHDKNSIKCDGFKNCSCISSLISQYPLNCAKQFYRIDSTVANRLHMDLWMENDISYLPNNESIFLIEEVSIRNDYRLIDNKWTNTTKEKLVELFKKNVDQLTENEIDLLDLFNKPLSAGKFFFLGSKLKLELMDEGLYHFRLTYLWGDQFCPTSIDLLILMISNTAILTNYTFNYFLACILILMLMFIIWIIYVIFYENIFQKYYKYFLQLKKETFFNQRSINDNINFEMLVKIREQSQRLLPYRHINPRVEKSDVINHRTEKEQIALLKNISQIKITV